MFHWTTPLFDRFDYVTGAHLFRSLQEAPAKVEKLECLHRRKTFVAVKGNENVG